MLYVNHWNESSFKWQEQQISIACQPSLFYALANGPQLKEGNC
jgi:hypothetical protein